MSVEEILDACPACGSARLGQFLRSNERQILRCDECSLLFVSPRASEETIKRHFVEEYIGTEERVSEDFTRWREHSLRREAARIRALRPGGGRLLDLGTASGAFLGEFANYPQWQVEGVEPSKYAAREASRRFGVPVHAGFLRDLGLPSASFDVVCSLDAFMFHPQPKADLAEIARLLRPGGLLAIEIPGLRFRLLKNSGLLCRLLYGVPARLNAGVHLFYYSRQTLRAMVAPFGFEEVAAHPEQSPTYGNALVRFGNGVYYLASAALYRLSGGRLHLAPKEFVVYRKRAA